MTFYEIPLKPYAQEFEIGFATQRIRLRFMFQDVPDGGWFMDILDVKSVPIICGIPLVTGADLLGQFGYLGLGGPLFVVTDADSAAVPTFDNLGTGSHLFLGIL